MRKPGEGFTWDSPLAAKCRHGDWLSCTWNACMMKSSKTEILVCNHPTQCCWIEYIRYHSRECKVHILGEGLELCMYTHTHTQRLTVTDKVKSHIKCNVEYKRLSLVFTFYLTQQYHYTYLCLISLHRDPILAWWIFLVNLEVYSCTI